MDASERALSRLRNPSSRYVHSLAALLVEETISTPLRDIAAPRWIASQIAAALEAMTHGTVAREWVDRKIAEGRAEWREEQRPLRTWMPSEAEEPLRQLLSRPWSPDERLTFRVIDQPAMRNLVREVLEDTLLRFQKKLRTIDATALGSLGMRAARKGKGLLGGMAHNLGGLTENLVGAVTEELEHVVQQRVRDFVANATGEAIKSIARHLADPQYARAFGELRLAVLDVVLDTPMATLADEVDKLKPEELVDVVVGALRGAADSPDFIAHTEQRVSRALEAAGDGTLGAWLDDVGLRDVWTQTTTELLEQRIGTIVHTKSFEDWWRSLFE